MSRLSRFRADCNDNFSVWATWRDVVAAVLEQCAEPVTLTFLYEKIEPHKKAQANKWWKEKVRQTLQINPRHFAHDGRGMWSLNRSAA